MTPILGIPPSRSNRRKCVGLFLPLLLAGAGLAWLHGGPHRRVPARFLEEEARRGLVVEVGWREEGWWSTTLHDIRLSTRDNTSFSMLVSELTIKHWPFGTPQVRAAGITLHLQGDPVTAIDSASKVWSSSRANLAIMPVDVVYTHRVLGTLYLDRMVSENRGEGFPIDAERVRLGDRVWKGVRLSVERRKGALVIGLGPRENQKGAQLTCFSSQRGMARWLLDVPHSPMRPLLEALGLHPGDDFALTRGAGSLSLDIPDDGAQPVRGRVQMVVDGWPLYAPAGAEPILGPTFSVLSNVALSDNDSRWDLPAAELTTSVFSLAGQGSLQLGRDKRLVLDVKGERTCQQLRGLLPPGPARDEVRSFLERAGAALKQSARLEVGWDTQNQPNPFRPVWHFEPGCGLAPWSPSP